MSNSESRQVRRARERADRERQEYGTAPNDGRWAGLPERWFAAYGVPTDDPQCSAPEEAINTHLRLFLPKVTTWLVENGVADRLVTQLEVGDGICGLADILMVRVANSRCACCGDYCDGVARQSIAVMDWGRLAMAFVEAYESPMASTRVGAA